MLCLPIHCSCCVNAGLGSALSAADLQAVAQLLREFAERALLPKLEERMNRLNISISATRKGIRNRLTRLWKTGAGTDGPSQDVSYPWHSVEGQMRQLADLAMLLRHYEFAVSMYRLAAQDFLSAPNNKWYAGVEVGRHMVAVSTCCCCCWWPLFFPLCSI